MSSSPAIGLRGAWVSASRVNQTIPAAFDKILTQWQEAPRAHSIAGGKKRKTKRAELLALAGEHCIPDIRGSLAAVLKLAGIMPATGGLYLRHTVEDQPQPISRSFISQPISRFAALSNGVMKLSELQLRRGLVSSTTIIRRLPRARRGLISSTWMTSLAHRRRLSLPRLPNWQISQTSPPRGLVSRTAARLPPSWQTPARRSRKSWLRSWPRR
jgi:hypothetical protein